MTELAKEILNQIEILQAEGKRIDVIRYLNKALKETVQNATTPRR